MGVVLLDDDQSLPFPNPEEADAQGLIALSKQLGVQRLITAYRQGIFPWMKLDEAPFTGAGSLQIPVCVSIHRNSKYREA